MYIKAVQVRKMSPIRYICHDTKKVWAYFDNYLVENGLEANIVYELSSNKK